MLINLELIEPNLSENGYKYGHEQLPDIYVESSKSEAALFVDVSNVDVTVIKKKISKSKKFNCL